MTFTEVIPIDWDKEEDERGVFPRYNGCTCECHRNPNVMHVMPCCYPSKEVVKEESNEPIDA